MPDRIGQQLGNYRILREIGRGGFADVYLGEHVYLHSLAALKVLHTSLDQSEMLHFLSEAQTLVRLRHPHIVRVLEYVVEQGTPVLMMDYAPGGTIRELHLRGSRLPLLTVIDYVKQVASALHYAHGKSVIHRDIKPENLLLGEEQELLLSDFGLALLAPSPEELSTQEMAGTIPYMAPEQIRGKPGFATDQYALGVITYEWLCGKRPFEGSSWAVLRQHLDDSPPRLREQRADLPEGVEEVVLRALAKDPKLRFVSVQAFASALERASRASGVGEDTEITVKLIPVPVPSSAPLLERAWPDTYVPSGVYLAAASADEPFTAHLKADLEAHGILVWNGRYADAHAIADREEAMRQEIRAARLVAMVLSFQTRSSRTVKTQLQVARMYGRELLLIWQSGEVWKELLPTNWEPTNVIDLVDARGRRYQEALDQIASSLEQGSATTRPLDLRLAVSQQEEKAPRNPYKGLRAFTEADAEDFFGRDRLVASLIEGVAEMTAVRGATSYSSRLLTIVGPSGSGKSSVLRAGLMPWLRQGALPGSDLWLYLAPMVPGRHPLEALGLLLAPHFPERSFASLSEDLEDDAARGLHVLASRLVAQLPGARVVLMVDQFEELFTQTEAEAERQRFIDLVLAATSEPRGPLAVVLTLRADFYDRPMRYPDLHRLMQQHQVQVLPMELQELRATIEYPATLPDVQLTFEGTLVGDLLYEMQGQHGALPLLQFTLEQLVERRAGHRVTLEAYRAIGGVKGALAKHAERTYATLPSEEHRGLARVLFLRLIDPGLTEQDTTRRRAALAEFTLPSVTRTRLLRETIYAFIAARLLIAGEVSETNMLEVAHEALIREWPRLSDWLRGAREDVRLQQTLSEDVVEWEQRGKPRDRLYRGSQLKEANAWARRNPPSKQEATFLRKSAAQRVRAVVSALVVFVLMMASLGTAGWFLTHQAPDPTRVTNLNDLGPGSLRQTIDTTPPGGTVTFDASLSGTIRLTSNDLTITKNLTVRGLAAHTITLSGGSSGHSVHVLTGFTVFFFNLIFKGSAANPRFTHNTALINNSGTLSMTNCIVSDNSGAWNGGGIYNTGTLSLSNSTISGNTASDTGGGIEIYPPSSVDTSEKSVQATITFSTLTNNSARVGTDIDISVYLQQVGGQVTISTSIVAGNSASARPDISGMLDSAGYNLFQDNSGAIFDPSTSAAHRTDKLLPANDLPRLFASPAGLRENGGATRTLALAPNSPAVDAIPVVYCSHNRLFAQSDQRGVPRPDGSESACDIGAFEYKD